MNGLPCHLKRRMSLLKVIWRVYPKEAMQDVPATDLRPQREKFVATLYYDILDKAAQVGNTRTRVRLKEQSTFVNSSSLLHTSALLYLTENSQLLYRKRKFQRPNHYEDHCIQHSFPENIPPGGHC
jgi:hypothetical protein